MGKKLKIKGMGKLGKNKQNVRIENYWLKVMGLKIVDVIKKVVKDLSESKKNEIVMDKLEEIEAELKKLEV